MKVKKYNQNSVKNEVKHPNHFKGEDMNGTFWNDCLEFEQLQGNITHVKNFEDFNSHKRSNSQSFNLKHKAHERCMILYEKAKIKNEVNKIMFLKNYEIKEQKELEECTFKPKINLDIMEDPYYNVQKFETDDHNPNKSLYDRSMNWKVRKTIKRNQLNAKKEIENEDELKFSPQINKMINLKQKLKNSNYEDDFSTKMFIHRQMQARMNKQINNVMNRHKYVSTNKVINFLI